jgi:hypothetical protein
MLKMVTESSPQNLRTDYHTAELSMPTHMKNHETGQAVLV